MPGTDIYSTFTLKFDAVTDDFACSVSRAAFVASPHVVRSRTVCGVKGSAGRSEWNLEIEGFQDWLDAVSLVDKLTTGHGTKAVAKILYTAEDGSGTVEATGTVTLVETGFGGSVDELLTFSVSLPVDGKPTFVATPTP